MEWWQIKETERDCNKWAHTLTLHEESSDFAGSQMHLSNSNAPNEAFQRPSKAQL